MTLLEIPCETFREGSIPVLETERLVLRAPRLGDATWVAALANDKRIAENTRRIPHPYTRADAEDFITSTTKTQGSKIQGPLSLLITLRDGTGIGGCGLPADGKPGAEIGYW